MVPKIGQRYKLLRTNGFIAEVVRINSDSSTIIKIVQDLGYDCPIGHIFYYEKVGNTLNYELLEGQESP
jgi:hypothetical protein